MIAVSYGVFNGGARLRSALRTLDSLAKSFVIRVEVKKVILGIDTIAGLVCLQDGFKKPGGMTDVPARRTHEVSRLYDVVLNFERCDDLHRARTHVRVEVGDRNGLRR